MLAGKNKGIRTRQVIFQQPVNGRTNAFGVFTQVAQVVADKRHLSLMRIYVFDTADLLHRLRVGNIAAQAVDSICGVNNNAPVLQAFHHLFYQPGLGIIRVYVNQQEKIN